VICTRRGNGKIKKKIYEILEVAAPGDLASRIFDIFIIILIFLNVLAVILETIEDLSSQYSQFFKIFEIFSVIVFTLEYILRIWSSTADPKYKYPISGRIRFIFKPLLLVDLFAILPFYLPMFIPFDLRFIRAIRLIRLFRLFKIGRYSESIRLFGKVLRSKKEELFITVFAVFILLIIASSLLYYVEHKAQPEAF